MAEGDPKVLRVIDANFNRAKEGLRVCEDICRFEMDHAVLSRQLKSVRHRLTDAIGGLGYAKLVACRDIEGDIGTGTTRSESRRKRTDDIFDANIQRVKESLRVLEEFAKLINRRVADSVKRLRYQVYGIEKKVFVFRGAHAK